MKKPAIDLVADTVPVVGDNALKAIAAEAQRIIDLEAEIAALEQAIIDRKEELRKVRRVELPELFAENQLKTGLVIYAKANDRTVEAQIDISDYYLASMPSETAIARERDPSRRKALASRRDGCLSHLRKIKAGDIIKTQLIIEFGRGDDKQAQSLIKEVKRRKLEYETKTSVNNRSLTKLGRELRQHGHPLPATLFSIEEGREAEVTITQRKED